MKILYLGSFCESDLFDKIINNSKKNKPSIAQQKLERLLLEGLCNIECYKVSAISIVPIPRYPQYNHLLFKQNAKPLANKSKLLYFSFINLPVLKQLSLFVSCFIKIFDWLFKNRRDKSKVIFIYSMNLYESIPALFLRLFFRHKVITIVTEINRFRFVSKTSPLLYFKMQINRAISNLINYSFDGYILLTQAMNEIINKYKRPFIVVEGIAEATNKAENINKSSAIMYAGSLHKKYGIKKLVKAFLLLENTKVELWIFGQGDFENEIKSLALKNSRIKFFGIMHNEIIIQKEQQALLLINPRTSDEQFTKYSFPSKNIEYMASGTPLVAARLQGIPSEYFEYIYTISDESVIGISQLLEQLLCKPQEELNEFGRKAAEFVLSQKNSTVQAEKIINFINTL